MQRVAELVEHRGRLVPGHQRRTIHWLGDVEMVGHDWQVAGQPGLGDVGVHPRSAALGRAGKRIEHEDRQLAAILVEHVIGGDVGVVNRQVGTLLEGQAVELARGVEHAVLQHVLHFQVGLELRLVEVVLVGADLLGVIRPVPRLQLEAGLALGRLLLVDHGLQIGAFTLGIGNGRRGQLAQHPVDRFRGLRGFVGEDVRGVGRVAEHLRLLGAQLQDRRHQLGVVELIAAAATVDRGLEQALAQRAVFQLRLQRLTGGVEQGNDVLALLAGGLGRVGRGSDLVGSHAGQFFFAVDGDGRRVYLAEHILVEAGAEIGQFAVDLFQADLVGFRQLGTRADQPGVVALDQADAFGIQAERGTRVIQRLDARKQLGVERDRIAVRRQQRGVLRLDRLAGVVGVRADQAEEHRRGAVQDLARFFQCDDGVVEGRRFAVVSDGFHFLQVVGHAAIKTWAEVGVGDLVKRRVMQRQAALGKEGVVAGFVHSGAVLGGGLPGFCRVGVGLAAGSQSGGKRHGQSQRERMLHWTGTSSM